jgi:transcriptional regulator with XRE-family HTH domain
MTHWTAQNTDAFIRRITFDFWTQIQKRMEVLPVTQLELARLFDVSGSAISQTLNNSKNPQLKTLVNYAKALKMNVALVPYPDDDPDGRPVNSEIFTICWEKAGRPRTFGQASTVRPFKSAFNSDSLIVPETKGGYYKVTKKHAATYDSGDQLMFFFGAGASFKADSDMPTAITQALAEAA